MCFRWVIFVTQFFMRLMRTYEAASSTQNFQQSYLQSLVNSLFPLSPPQTFLYCSKFQSLSLLTQTQNFSVSVMFQETMARALQLQRMYWFCAFPKLRRRFFVSSNAPSTCSGITTSPFPLGNPGFSLSFPWLYFQFCLNPTTSFSLACYSDLFSPSILETPLLLRFKRFQSSSASSFPISSTSRDGLGFSSSSWEALDLNSEQLESRRQGRLTGMPKSMDLMAEGNSWLTEIFFSNIELFNEYTIGIYLVCRFNHIQRQVEYLGGMQQFFQKWIWSIG